MDRLAQEPPVDLETTAESIEKVFVDALQRLRIQGIEQRMDVLHGRGTLLTPDERRELPQLYRDKQELQQSLSTQGRPDHETGRAG